MTVLASIGQFEIDLGEKSEKEVLAIAPLICRRD